MTTLIIDGARIYDIASFYAEMNRVLMQGEDWELGHSLDALDDALYGGYGALKGQDEAVLHWIGFDRNRTDLGIAATRAWLLDKLDPTGPFDQTRVTRDLAALDAGTGQTFFDIVLQIIADHPNIRLVRA